MAVNKVVYGDQTLIDLTSDTVTADKVLSGYTYTGSDGVKQTGTYIPPTIPDFVTIHTGSTAPSDSLGV